MPQDNWTQLACPRIWERMARYSQNEIRFNLLAIVRSRIHVLQDQLRLMDLAEARALRSIPIPGTANLGRAPSPFVEKTPARLE